MKVVFDSYEYRIKQDDGTFYLYKRIGKGAWYLLGAFPSRLEAHALRLYSMNTGAHVRGGAQAPYSWEDAMQAAAEDEVGRSKVAEYRAKQEDDLRSLADLLTEKLGPHSERCGRCMVTNMGGGLMAVEVPLHGGGFAWIDDEEYYVRIGFYRSAEEANDPLEIVACWPITNPPEPGMPGRGFDDVSRDEVANEVAHAVLAVCGCGSGTDG